MRKCPKCNKIKNFDEFYEDKNGKDGISCYCKSCVKQHVKNYRVKFRDNINQKKKDDYQKNKSKILEKNKKHRKTQKGKEAQKKARDKRRSTLKGRLNHNISNGILKSLKRNKKNYHWEDIVGYTIDDLISHLKQTVPEKYIFEDLLNGRLHIDHIIPISLYNYSSFNDNEFKKCWSLRNLRLLEAGENYAKGNNLNIELIEKMEIKDLLPEGENICL